MTEESIQRQLESLKSVTSKGLQSKAASMMLLNKLSKFSPSARPKISTNLLKKAK